MFIEFETVRETKVLMPISDIKSIAYFTQHNIDCDARQGEVQIYSISDDEYFEVRTPYDELKKRIAHAISNKDEIVQIAQDVSNIEEVVSRIEENI